MQNPLRGGIRVMTNRSVYALHFVGGNTSAYAGAADQNPALRFTILDCASNLLGNIREIHGLGAICSHINRLMTCSTHGLKHSLLQGKTCMVKPNSDFHDTPP